MNSEKSAYADAINSTACTQSDAPDGAEAELIHVHNALRGVFRDWRSSLCVRTWTWGSSRLCSPQECVSTALQLLERLPI